jgi:hypothetical protein
MTHPVGLRIRSQRVEHLVAPEARLHRDELPAFHGQLHAPVERHIPVPPTDGDRDDTVELRRARGHLGYPPVNPFSVLDDVHEIDRSGSADVDVEDPLGVGRQNRAHRADRRWRIGARSCLR